MIYIDWAYAGKVATCGVLAIWAMAWITKKLIVLAVVWDMEERKLQLDREHRGYTNGFVQNDAPDYHQMMPAVKPRRVA